MASPAKEAMVQLPAGCQVGRVAQGFCQTSGSIHKIEGQPHRFDSAYRRQILSSGVRLGDKNPKLYLPGSAFD